MKTAKVSQASPQHASVIKDRENSEVNDYDEEGDLEEEEVSKRESEWIKKCLSDIFVMENIHFRLTHQQFKPNSVKINGFSSPWNAPWINYNNKLG